MNKRGKIWLSGKAKNAQRESKYVDFKSEFNIAARGDWCELIKDIIAIANTGGGLILLGVKNNGEASGKPPLELLELDEAQINDKMRRYISTQFDGFSVSKSFRNRKQVVVFEVDGATFPIIFTAPGNYPDPQNMQKQKTAFSQGTIYFRHGSKSEPATQEDVDKFIERILHRERNNMMKNVAKVIEAPSKSVVQIIPAVKQLQLTNNSQGEKVRITRDRAAPAMRLETPDTDYPYRQKELINQVNAQLVKKKINQYDILSIRRVYKINNKTHPEFCYRPKFGTFQFNDRLVDWIIGECKKNHTFFEETRKRYKLNKQ